MTGRHAHPFRHRRWGDEEHDGRGFRVHLIWTQWRVGVWWWPVRKDLAFGLELGPLQFTWVRR